jgi:ferredoxin
MRIPLDRDVRVAHGHCEFVAPEVFMIDDDGEAL